MDGGDVIRNDQKPLGAVMPADKKRRSQSTRRPESPATTAEHRCQWAAPSGSTRAAGWPHATAWRSARESGCVQTITRSTFGTDQLAKLDVGQLGLLRGILERRVRQLHPKSRAEANAMRKHCIAVRSHYIRVRRHYIAVRRHCIRVRRHYIRVRNRYIAVRKCCVGVLRHCIGVRSRYIRVRERCIGVRDHGIAVRNHCIRVRRRCSAVRTRYIRVRSRCIGVRSHCIRVRSHGIGGVAVEFTFLPAASFGGTRARASDRSRSSARRR